MRVSWWVGGKVYKHLGRRRCAPASNAQRSKEAGLRKHGERTGAGGIKEERRRYTNRQAEPSHLLINDVAVEQAEWWWWHGAGCRRRLCCRRRCCCCCLRPRLDRHPRVPVSARRENSAEAKPRGHPSIGTDDADWPGVDGWGAAASRLPLDQNSGSHRFRQGTAQVPGEAHPPGRISLAGGCCQGRQGRDWHTMAGEGIAPTAKQGSAAVALFLPWRVPSRTCPV